MIVGDNGEEMVVSSTELNQEVDNKEKKEKRVNRQREDKKKLSNFDEEHINKKR